MCGPAWIAPGGPGYGMVRGVTRDGRWMVQIMALVLVAACPGPRAPHGGEFRVFYPDAGAHGLEARIGQRMQAKPAAACSYPDGREARWANAGASVAAGELPPGLVLEDGAIGGLPTAKGSYQVTVRFAGVTCATKPEPDQQVIVRIIVH